MSGKKYLSSGSMITEVCADEPRLLEKKKITPIQTNKGAYDQSHTRQFLFGSELSATYGVTGPPML
jgi:hypothetical protein